MTLYLRVYPTEQGATDVAARLAAAGFRSHTILLASEQSGREAVAVSAAVRSGALPERITKYCTRTLEQGRSIVSVDALFGRGKTVVDIMESAETFDGDVLSRFRADVPAPLSEVLLFGIPVLSEYSASTGLLRSDWSVSAVFGFGLLSRSAAPLSSMFGMKVLSAPKEGWRSSFGMSLLSENPAPLSSLLGMKTVSSRERPRESSFGFPLLYGNPAPLSSLFGFATLIRGR